MIIAPAGPKAFSYWIAGMFGNSSQPVQQLLLQEDSIITRRVRTCMALPPSGFGASSCMATWHVIQMQHCTVRRLRSLSEYLGKHVDYLRAALALESLNTSSDEPSKDTDKGGGDDTPVRGDDTPQTS